MRRLLCLILLAPLLALAQDGIYDLGARNKALSGASITLNDHWSSFNNPGALGSVQNSGAFVSFQNRYNLQGFHVIGGGAVYSNRLVNTGVKYYKFGDDHFNQQLAGIVLANRFQMVSLGIGVNVIQTHIEGQQTDRIIAVEMGGTAEITKSIILGAHIFNLQHSRDNPTTMKAGISFRPTDNLMLNTEVEKQIEANERIKTGLEYEVISNVFVRSGVNIQGNDVHKAQVNGTFGLGFRLKKFDFDYAFTSETLGAIHEISLVYLLNKKL